MTPSTYHTHTVYCDGKSTPEEMVQAAIALGCPELGFSGHSYTPFDGSFCMTQENTLGYQKAVRQMQEAYGDRIKILLGIEQDYYSQEPTEGYDYVIGSVHYVLKDGHYLPIDASKESQIESVNQFYGGDFYSFIEDYFAVVADVYRKTGCQIIGHFDIITKFNRDGDLFDPQHPRYRAAAEKALHALLDAPAALEVNTGAMSRGYTTAPYPAPDILQRWLAAGKQIIYSSDCHHADHLLFGYDAYEQLVASCQKK